MFAIKSYVDLIALNRELDSGEQFPPEYLEPFKSLWADETIQKVISRGNEIALQDNFT